MGAWLDFTTRPGERISYETVCIPYARQTKFQKLEIADTVTYGRALFLDDKIQSAELDEFIYHEALVHPALVLHPEPRSILVVGGGEGATVREVLRHRGIERIVMVDIDEEAVEACRRYLESMHQGALDDPRTDVVHADARAYLEARAETFDSIIVDATDPLDGGPSYRLFTREFYQLAANHLGEHGTLAVQAESVDLNVLQPHLSIVTTLREVFPHAAAYQTHVPSFGESWGFAVAAKTRDPRLLGPHEIDATLAERGCSDLRLYDGEAHTRLFALPRYLRQLLSEHHQIVTDDCPVFVA